MYKLIVFILGVVLSFAIEIDSSVEKNLAKNDAATRLMLVNYYFDKNLTKAQIYNDQVLRIDKYNKQAKRNKYRLEKRRELLKITKGKSIDAFYRDLYFNNKYKEIKKLSKYLPVITTDYPKLVTAKIYLWDGDYKKVHQILKMIKDKTTLDYVELSGYESFYNGDYNRAKNDFSVLYNATGKLEYAYRLIDSLIYLGEIDKASKFVNALLKVHPDDEQLLKYQKNIKAKEEAQVKALTDKYNKSGDFADLQPLLYFLMNNHQKDKAYKLLQDYIKKHPEDNKAKYWYATYLSWDGNNAKALDILQKMVTERDYKTKLLIAKIYSWNANYDKSLNYINDILVNCPDKQIKTDAEELKGLIYFWKQDYAKAKPVLEDVLKKKNSEEAKEALMVINGNLKPLIAKYKKLYKKDITNLDYILRIAQYSEKIGDIDTALKFYEKYNKLNPDNLNVAHRLAQLYLAKKDFYKAFSYYEYWAYKKGDVKSLYELAQNYYYAGFSKSALNVINDILKLQDYKPALDLKAKILRYAPKFVTNNDSKTVADIFAEKDSKLLEVGNRLYFNGFYDDASKYYHEYLLSNPDDAEIRERYAYSLEFSDKYKPASGEFFLLTWAKKDCNILYHYGYNLEKSGKRKLAKKVYKEALKYAALPAPKFIVNFIEQWKKAWESQKIYRYKKFYDDKYKKNKYWTIRKQSIFDSVKFISLYLADISVINEYKKGEYNYYTVRFWQQYSTNKKVDKGYKTLVLKCKNHKCVITDEKWQKGKYIPQDYQCQKDIELRLKNIDKAPVKENINKGYVPTTAENGGIIGPDGRVIVKKKLM